MTVDQIELLRKAQTQITHAERFLELAEQLLGPLPPDEKR